MICVILAVLASQMRASSYYIMTGYILRCKHIITNSTDVGRFAKAFGSIHLYKVLRRFRIFHTIWIWNVPICVNIHLYIEIIGSALVCASGDAVSIYV